MKNGIILPPYKSIYWFVPKVACTTLKAHFGRLLELPAPKGNVHAIPFETTDKHIDGFKSFAVVRHPYARMLSLWMNKIAPGHPVHPSFKENIDHNVFGKIMYKIKTDMPFEDFVITLLNSGARNTHWTPQSGMIPEEATIYKMEDSGSFLRCILPVLNPSHKRDSWKDKFTTEMKKVMNDYYADDMRRFGYESKKTVLIDCDGVLTDGNLNIDHSGEKLFKRFHSKDVRSIRELVANGYRVVIVTADDWEGGFSFARKVGAEIIVSRDKAETAKSIEGEIIAVGDDAWDVGMLKAADVKFCPADADESVNEIEGIIKLNTPGGKGVIAEIVRRIIPWM